MKQFQNATAIRIRLPQKYNASNETWNVMTEDEREQMFLGLHKYKIIDFHYRMDQYGIDETYIDLTFACNEKVIRLRFLSPVDIRLSGAFHPQQGGGFQILDIKHRLMDDISIQVCNSEPMEGNFEFYARTVDKIFEGDNQDI